ncbi:hypothetical protein [Azospirillum baldaniorum]|uniref:hypothetical protein n=1 Tax=Azospirillum baldaniorum TaxID=1064539 RepID=UPI001FCB229D|nr:hypothetical protein [Azospirillum baldaniorum]
MTSWVPSSGIARVWPRQNRTSRSAAAFDTSIRIVSSVAPRHDLPGRGGQQGDAERSFGVRNRGDLGDQPLGQRAGDAGGAQAAAQAAAHVVRADAGGDQLAGRGDALELGGDLPDQDTELVAPEGAGGEVQQIADALGRRRQAGGQTLHRHVEGRVLTAGTPHRLGAPGQRLRHAGAAQEAVEVGQPVDDDAEGLALRGGAGAGQRGQAGQTALDAAQQRLARLVEATAAQRVGQGQQLVGEGKPIVEVAVHRRDQALQRRPQVGRVADQRAHRLPPVNRFRQHLVEQAAVRLLLPVLAVEAQQRLDLAGPVAARLQHRGEGVGDQPVALLRRALRRRRQQAGHPAAGQRRVEGRERVRRLRHLLQPGEQPHELVVPVERLHPQQRRLKGGEPADRRIEQQGLPLEIAQRVVAVELLGRDHRLIVPIAAQQAQQQHPAFEGKELERVGAEAGGPDVGLVDGGDGGRLATAGAGLLEDDLFLARLIHLQNPDNRKFRKTKQIRRAFPGRGLVGKDPVDVGFSALVDDHFEREAAAP